MKLAQHYKVLLLAENGKVEITTLHCVRERFLCNYKLSLVNNLVPKRNYSETEVFEWGEVYDEVHNKRYLLAEVNSEKEAVEKLYELDKEELRQMGIYIGRTLDELKNSLPTIKEI